MYAAIRSIVPDAAFTIFTGDIVDHAVWLVNDSQVTFDINDAYSRMTGLPKLYTTIGNHEAVPVNAFNPAAVQTSLNIQWLYNLVETDLEPLIGSDAQEEVNFGAYSTLYPGGNLRIISINSNLYYKENYWLYEPTMERDPSGQLAWLVTELDAAEQNGERVYIIGHMAMGLSDALHDGSNYFNQIVDRYSATIAALFWGKSLPFIYFYVGVVYINIQIGHTHVDQFEIAYSDYTNPTFENALEVSYLAPSMTPTSGPPAFQVLTVDPVTFGVLDITTYIANISSPDYQNGPVWQEYYSAKAAYGPLVSPPLTDPAAELTPAFWHNVTVAFETNDDAFQNYYARKSRGWDVSSCTGTCQTTEICGLRAAEAQYNCATVTPGISFKKRDEGSLERSLGHIEESVCDGARLKPLLNRLAARDGLLEEALRKAQLKHRK
jgi:sphingomyelin phosphodiesterase